MNQRYFRSDADTYEGIRLGLDAQWGHGPGTGTRSCFEPAETAPKDRDGRLLLAVLLEFCEYEAVADLLPNLIASGAVQEIDAATYHAAVNPAPL